MNEKPKYVYITDAEYEWLMQRTNPFDAGDFDEAFIPGYRFALYDEIQDDEWAWAEDHSQYIVIKGAAYNASNQIIIDPLAG